MAQSHNLVFQVNIDSGNRGHTMFSYVPELYRYASQAALEYAREVGASYQVICRPVLDIYDFHPAWQRYVIFEPEFDIYDWILYLDADVVARGPDIFERYQEPGFYAVPVVDSDPNIEPGRKASIARQLTLFKLHESTYFNSGVLLVDRETRKKIRGLGWKNQILDFNNEDQPTINRIVQDHVGLRKLDWRFNFLLRRPDQFERARQAFFIHFMSKNLFKVNGG